MVNNWGMGVRSWEFGVGSSELGVRSWEFGVALSGRLRQRSLESKRPYYFPLRWYSHPPHTFIEGESNDKSPPPYECQFLERWLSLLY